MSKLYLVGDLSMECSLLDLLQMQKDYFHPSIHGNRSFQELHHTLNLSITQESISPRNSLFVSAPPYMFALSENCLYSLALCSEKK